MPYTGADQLLNAATGRVLPGNITLLASFFRAAHPTGSGRIQRQRLHHPANGKRLIVCGDTKVGDPHVCGR